MHKADTSVRSALALTAVLLAVGWWRVVQLGGSWGEAVAWSLFVLLHVKAFCGSRRSRRGHEAPPVVTGSAHKALSQGRVRS